LCVLVVAIGISATALASALGGGPKPAPKPLAQAVHDSLAAPAVQGVSANITLTNHLLEGASLASGGGGGGNSITSSPLLNGGSGRLWISHNGDVRIELQAEKGDTDIYWDGTTLSAYDASSNTLYRYTPSKQEGGTSDTPQPETGTADHEAPSVAKIEEGLAHMREHVDVSEAKPDDVAGQPAYTVRVSPKEGGSLIAGAELSFDANNGVPLRTAIYSTTSSAPVIELAATEISYGTVPASVFSFTPPANAKIEDVKAGEGGSTPHASGTHEPPKLTTHGHGIAAIEALETSSHAGKEGGETMEQLPKVSINGASASELRTALGTVLSFESGGVRHVLAGFVPPAAVEALARGL
jgi:outer membrane lipoprotein-sorting protein